jgi:hypothetical protein
VYEESIDYHKNKMDFDMVNEKNITFLAPNVNK